MDNKTVLVVFVDIRFQSLYIKSGRKYLYRYRVTHTVRLNNGLGLLCENHGCKYMIFVNMFLYFARAKFVVAVTDRLVKQKPHFDDALMNRWVFRYSSVVMSTSRCHSVCYV